MPENEKPRLRIKKLTIENFRGIDHLELDFIDHNDEPLDLVVFAGGNGVGKTSVLEALLLLVNFKQADSFFTSKTNLEQIRFGAAQISFWSKLAATLQNKVFEMEFGISDQEFRTNKLPKATVRGINPFPDETQRGPLIVREAEVEYFSMSRSSDAVREKNLIRFKEMLIKTYYRMLRNKETTSEPFEKINQMWQFFHGNEQELDVIQLDNNPGSDFEVVIRDPRPIPSNITSLAQARELALTRSDIPNMVPLDRLSSGQLALLSFAGPLIFRDKPVDFVFIDEPEQHLHVQWQRFLLPALQKLAPQAQFFVATHSEEILNAVLSYERFILEPDDTHTEQAAQ